MLCNQSDFVNLWTMENARNSSWITQRPIVLYVNTQVRRTGRKSNPYFSEAEIQILSEEVEKTKLFRLKNIQMFR